MMAPPKSPKRKGSHSVLGSSYLAGQQQHQQLPSPASSSRHIVTTTTAAPDPPINLVTGAVQQAPSRDQSHVPRHLVCPTDAADAADRSHGGVAGVSSAAARARSTSPAKRARLNPAIADKDRSASAGPREPPEVAATAPRQTLCHAAALAGFCPRSLKGVQLPPPPRQSESSSTHGDKKNNSPPQILDSQDTLHKMMFIQTPSPHQFQHDVYSTAMKIPTSPTTPMTPASPCSPIQPVGGDTYPRIHVHDPTATPGAAGSYSRMYALDSVLSAEGGRHHHHHRNSDAHLFYSPEKKLGYAELGLDSPATGYDDAHDEEEQDQSRDSSPTLPESATTQSNSSTSNSASLSATSLPASATTATTMESLMSPPDMTDKQNQLHEQPHDLDARHCQTHNFSRRGQKSDALSSFGIYVDSPEDDEYLAAHTRRAEIHSDNGQSDEHNDPLIENSAPLVPLRHQIYGDRTGRRVFSESARDLVAAAAAAERYPLHTLPIGDFPGFLTVAEPSSSSPEEDEEEDCTGAAAKSNPEEHTSSVTLQFGTEWMPAETHYLDDAQDDGVGNCSFPPYISPRKAAGDMGKPEFSIYEDPEERGSQHKVTASRRTRAQRRPLGDIRLETLEALDDGDDFKENVY